MASVLQRGLRLTSSSSAAFQQPFRQRHVPSPGTLDQRLFREVTKPIYRAPKISRAEKYLMIDAEMKQRVSVFPFCI